MHRYYYILLLLIGFILFNSCGKSKRTYTVYNPPIVSVSDKERSVELSNLARGEVNSPPISWSNTLEDAASKYVSKLITNGKFVHDTESNYGENLYASSANSDMIISDSVNSWVAEKKDYRYSNNSCNPNAVCGHYTQVVWRDTTEVGCAVGQYLTGSYKGWYVVVCKYNPHGNIVGRLPY